VVKGVVGGEKEDLREKKPKRKKKFCSKGSGFWRKVREGKKGTARRQGGRKGSPVKPVSRGKVGDYQGVQKEDFL